MTYFYSLQKSIRVVFLAFVLSFPFLATAQQGMKVGAATAPDEMLDVNGAIKIASDFNNTTAAPVGGAGTIRFKSGQYEGWNGSAWIPLGGGADTDWIVSGTNQYSGVSGNVGIGNPAPTYKFDVKGLGVDAGPGSFDNVLGRFEQSTAARGAGIQVKGYRNSSGNVTSFVDLRNQSATDYSVARMAALREAGEAGSLLLYTNSGSALTEQMRILSNGNVGIGITNPTYKLHVNGKIRTNAINEISDGRLKKDIKKILNASELVRALDGVTYYWRTDEFPKMALEDRLQYGLIAQEVEKIVPELVNTDSEGWKSVEYTHLVPILLEALKEQLQTIDALKTQNEQFSASIEKLAAKEARNSTLLELIIAKGLLDGPEEVKSAVDVD